MIRTLIVEDEIWERKGIIRMVDWAGLGMELVAEAGNGEEALQIMASERIDLVMTDMNMPDVDGVHFLKDESLSGYDGEIIVISGYSDYEYMKQAIASRAFDYILKPFDANELNAVLRKACEKIAAKAREREAKREIEHILNTSKPLLRENLLNTLIASAPGEKQRETLEELAKIGIEMRWEYYRALVLSVGSWAGHAGAGARISSDVLGKLEAIPGGGMRSLIFRNAGDKNEIVVLCMAGEEPAASQNSHFRELAKRFAGAIKEDETLTVNAGVGDCARGIDGIRESYLQASKASKYENMERGNPAVFYSDIKDLPSNAASLLLPDDRRLINEMIRLNAADIPGIVAKRFSMLAENKYCKVSGVRRDIIDFIAMLEEYCQNNGMDFEGILGWNSLESLNDMNSIAAFEQFTSELLKRFTAAIRTRQIGGAGDNVIHQIIRYIEEHYMEEIKLITISQKYFINHIYLSRLFKNQTGENFIDYLTRIRMMKAKELLQNSNLKVKDVSKMVGYDNPYYFAKSFKKFFNYSPSEE